MHLLPWLEAVEAEAAVTAAGATAGAVDTSAVAGDTSAVAGTSAQVIHSAVAARVPQTSAGDTVFLFLVGTRATSDQSSI